MRVRIQHYYYDSPPELQNPRDNRKCLTSFSAQTSLRREDIEEFELEDKFLFENQLNASGKRIFDWVHKFGHNKRYFWGHWILPEDLIEINKLRDKRHRCGYCGYQTDHPEETFYWCNKCLSSSYLKEKDLYLLRLLPVSSSNKRSKEIPEDLIMSYLEMQGKFYANQKARLLKERDLFVARQEQKHKSIDKETEARLAIYDAGFDPQKLGVVYYDHNDTLQFGAIADLTDEQINQISQSKELIENIKCPWTIKRKKNTR